MTRDQAIQRINQGLGFRPSGNNLEPAILTALIEAQRDLEQGKTLPRFLMLENQPLVLVAGQHEVLIPGDFLRESDEVHIHYFPTSGSPRPVFLERKYYQDAVESITSPIAASTMADVPRMPKIYVMRRQKIDFITTADRDYTLFWDYYAAELTLNEVLENKWLRYAPEWIWGEAGWRMAMDLERAEAMNKFDAIRKMGRSNVFADDLAFELAAGPLQMGAGL